MSVGGEGQGAPNRGRTLMSAVVVLKSMVRMLGNDESVGVAPTPRAEMAPSLLFTNSAGGG